jgi:hypothetical protein
MPTNVYIKRTSPPGPGRAQVVLTPGNFESAGDWIATEGPHDGPPIFAVRSGRYSITSRVATLLGPDRKKAALIKDWGEGSHGTGSGETFDSTENSSMNVAWKLTPWPSAG